MGENEYTEHVLYTDAGGRIHLSRELGASDAHIGWSVEDSDDPRPDLTMELTYGDIERLHDALTQLLLPCCTSCDVPITGDAVVHDYNTMEMLCEDCERSQT